MADSDPAIIVDLEKVVADEGGPPLGSWDRLYAVVLGELALLILLFTLFARAFS